MKRITVSLEESDIEQLKKLIEKLDLSSPGQLLRMLLSGDPDRIDWIAKACKELHLLF